VLIPDPALIKKYPLYDKSPSIDKQSSYCYELMS
jgi:hypothetical protein